MPHTYIAYLISLRNIRSRVIIIRKTCMDHMECTLKHGDDRATTTATRGASSHKIHRRPMTSGSSLDLAGYA
eukprot:6177476-Pleurochrysis_carterae.AAC.3